VTKHDQLAKVRELQTLAIEEAVALANRQGCHEPRRIFIVIAFEEVGPDLWAHGSGIGHAPDVVPDAYVLMKEALDKIERPS